MSPSRRSRIASASAKDATRSFPGITTFASLPTEATVASNHGDVTRDKGHTRQTEQLWKVSGVVVPPGATWCQFAIVKAGGGHAIGSTSTARPAGRGHPRPLAGLLQSARTDSLSVCGVNRTEPARRAAAAVVGEGG